MNGSPPNKNNNSPFGDNNPQSNFTRNLLMWMFIIMSIFFVVMLLQTGNNPEERVTYTQYRSFVDAELIESAKIMKSQLNDFEFHGQLKQPITINVEGKPKEINAFVTKLGVVDSDTEALWASKNITWRYEEGDNMFWGAVLTILPFILLIVLMVFLFRRMQGGGMGGGGSKGIFNFGKARIKYLNESNEKVTFNDVAGADEAKYELEEVIEFLRNPDKFKRLGGKIPRGVLLLGPPGTGKTLLARAVAGEANVPFFSISGADFVEMFVGVGASRVRDLFEQAKKNNPCIIFIDEIDAVGRQRGAGLGGGHDEREQTLNQLLVEMDGFEQNNGVIIIAATNRPDVLDPALLRPGRFDRQVVVDRPDVRGREGIFKVHTSKVPLSADVDVNILARGTPGLSGADIANIVNEAALLAARRESNVVTMYDFENAKDKVLMGVERKSMVISDKEKEMTSYHEMGHALIGKILPYSDPVHKVTIIPRGRALGVTSSLPTEDLHSWSKEYLEAKLIMLMGGRAAEKIIFNNFTTGAQNDIQRATDMARKMVCEWGMSEKLGPINFANKREEVFIGREMSYGKEYSEETAQLIDEEVSNIVLDSYSKAEKLLLENLDLLHFTSKTLLERESLDAEELDMLLRGETLPPITKQTITALRTIDFNKLSKNETGSKQPADNSNDTDGIQPEGV